jgi:hypothetical protein
MEFGEWLKGEIVDGDKDGKDDQIRKQVIKILPNNMDKMVLGGTVFGQTRLATEETTSTLRRKTQMKARRQWKIRNTK